MDTHNVPCRQRGEGLGGSRAKGFKEAVNDGLVTLGRLRGLAHFLAGESFAEVNGGAGGLDCLAYVGAGHDALQDFAGLGFHQFAAPCELDGALVFEGDGECGVAVGLPGGAACVLSPLNRAQLQRPPANWVRSRTEVVWPGFPAS